jgi:hypothetical protein
MDNIINNLVIIVIIGSLIYLVFSNINLNITEGMATNDSNSSLSSSSGNGVAGNASSFAAQIKNDSIKMQDSLLISKYRKDYENVIINMDDLINNMMLNTILNYKSTGDLNKDTEMIDNLNKLNNAKTSLNSVMKFVDRT